MGMGYVSLISVMLEQKKGNPCELFSGKIFLRRLGCPPHPGRRTLFSYGNHISGSIVLPISPNYVSIANFHIAVHAKGKSPTTKYPRPM